MGKKQKHSEVEVVDPVKKDESAPERPKRTLLGWKDKIEENEGDSKVFQNKEIVLVTCSRRINYRYRHLILNIVSLLSHDKKDNKLESKETKGATLNELVELRGSSSCLFFEGTMGMKQKHSEAEVVVPVKKDESAPERPKRTLLGWKDKIEENEGNSKVFQNKEILLVTCSRRINYRYRHLILNIVSLLPHCKKDNKLEPKETKGATLNELVELGSSSSCLFFEGTMGKKRKHSETEVAVPVKKDESAPERPKRTLLGWKDKIEEKEGDSKVFRNKEKVLVTCSRRINYRYRHLMLNIVPLLPHCKKDNKLESKETKGATLNELVELRGSSSCLFFEGTMGKKRKHSEAEVAVPVKKDESAPERPKRTLLGWKDKIEEKEGDSKVFRNKEKVLVTCSRRINYRYRHLMLNIVSLLPHCKKDNKLESKETKGATLNELVELRGSSSCLFFECRKHKDLYLWMAKSPNGPSVKFLVNAVHTMEELKLTGNHLKGSRPLLTFSSNFDKDPHWKLLKEMITQIFGVPKDHRKSKPYHDHVFVFSIVDAHIWFRNYQISAPHSEADKVDRGGLDKMTLIEVGPRFCLNPIKIFGGSFGGPTLYENPFYISPNQIRALEKRKKAGKYAKKVKAKKRRQIHEQSNPLEPDEFAEMWKE